jgi:hypothetical protein
MNPAFRVHFVTTGHIAYVRAVVLLSVKIRMQIYTINRFHFHPEGKKTGTGYNFVFL